MRLEGKVALISGSARGMGAVEARLFVREGAKVVLGDILEVEGRKVEAEIRATGGDALFVGLGVTDESHWKHAVDTAVERFGKLNVLVNNAGVGSHGRIEEVTIEAWNRVMNINLNGVHYATRRAVESMVKNGVGRVVSLASVSAQRGGKVNSRVKSSRLCSMRGPDP